MTLDHMLSLRDENGMVLVPGERYTSREFFDLEMGRLWPRVWQVACREEEIPGPGDFLEYTIGEESILVTRAVDNAVKAYFNTCPHRGTRLARDTGKFPAGEVRCRYHGWRWGLDGRIVEVVDRQDYPATMTDDCVGLGQVQVGRWGGFVFINMDPDCEPFESFLGPIPALYDSYRFQDMRFRSYRTMRFECNWKTAVDAFNEGYHPQALHPQMLTWFNDTIMSYGQFGEHSGYSVPPERIDEMGTSPRLGLDRDEIDDREVFAERIDAMAGLFAREDQATLRQLRDAGPPEGQTVTQAFNELRLKAMRDRGYDLNGLADEQLLTSGTIHLFPNLVGPINYGNATLYRARPDGLDPDSTILDYWALEWPRAGVPTAPVERKFYDDWAVKDWGLINNQDFENLVEITRGMKSRGYRGALLNPVQEANLLHHHRVIDRYVTG